MKGFIKVSHVVITKHKTETDWSVEYIKEEFNLFIPKKQVTSVVFFDSNDEIKTFFSKNYGFDKEINIKSNYMIKVKNKSKYFVYKHGNFGNEPYVSKLLTYFVDPSENEHMERFIAGTDDAMYDYVELLKYMPRIEGSEMKKAEERISKKIL